MHLQLTQSRDILARTNLSWPLLRRIGQLKDMRHVSKMNNKAKSLHEDAPRVDSCKIPSYPSYPQQRGGARSPAPNSRITTGHHHRVHLF